MSHKRSSAASLNIDANTIWISGGFDGYNDLSSSEFITVEGSMEGPELPMPLRAHKMVAINNELTMIIGGRSYGSFFAETYYYNHSDEQWIDGPNMNQARYVHAAGIITDEATEERLVVVTGGFDVNGIDTLKSTELLLDDNWSLGKLSLKVNTPYARHVNTLWYKDRTMFIFIDQMSFFLFFK